MQFQTLPFKGQMIHRPHSPSLPHSFCAPIAVSVGLWWTTRTAEIVQKVKSWLPSDSSRGLFIPQLEVTLPLKRSTKKNTPKRSRLESPGEKSSPATSRVHKKQRLLERKFNLLDRFPTQWWYPTNLRESESFLCLRPVCLTATEKN